MKRVYFSRPGLGEDHIDIPDGDDPAKHIASHLITRCKEDEMKNHKPTWSIRDEQLLKELQERKAAFEKAHWVPVMDMVTRLNLKIEGLTHQGTAERMIQRADEIRDALEPFDSGVRPAPPSE